jgi:hypothetical protein
MPYARITFDPLTKSKFFYLPFLPTSGISSSPKKGSTKKKETEPQRSSSLKRHDFFLQRTVIAGRIQSDFHVTCRSQVSITHAIECPYYCWHFERMLLVHVP